MKRERIKFVSSPKNSKKYAKGTNIKYIWNDLTCDGMIDFDYEVKSLNAVFYIIEKLNAPWDGNSPSSCSIGWSNTKRRKVYPLGIPSDSCVIKSLIISLAKTMTKKKIDDIKDAIVKLNNLLPEEERFKISYDMGVKTLQ